MQDVKSMIRSFLLDNFVMSGELTITDDASFMETHLLDSTGFVELLTFIEKTYGVRVPDQDLVPENFDSLRNIESYLGRKGALRVT